MCCIEFDEVVVVLVVLEVDSECFSWRVLVRSSFDSLHREASCIKILGDRYRLPLSFPSFMINEKRRAKS
ncbi:hypothetical protein ACHAWO_001991 [Cyclotella atomus]|uniref:Uncharacterized protein n=1 Tax=Cyclotella atomus TaxID=382360 RepID=A0ABD3NFC4_9STRA